MIIQGHNVTYGGGLNGSHIPVPTTPHPIRSRQGTSPFTRVRYANDRERFAAQREARAILDALDRRRAGLPEAVADTTPTKAAPANTTKGPRRTPGPPKGTGNNPTFDVDKAITEYQAGETLAVVSDRHGVRPQTLAAHMNKRGIPRRPRHQKANVEGIIADRANGLSVPAIAARQGVHESIVYKWLKDSGETFGRGGASELKARLIDLGVTGAQIREWAKATGRTAPRAGLPSFTLIDAYLAENPTHTRRSAS